jgi:DNA-binding CsgD family transcriptional regulator
LGKSTIHRAHDYDWQSIERKAIRLRMRGTKWVEIARVLGVRLRTLRAHLPGPKIGAILEASPENVRLAVPKAGRPQLLDLEKAARLRASGLSLGAMRRRLKTNTVYYHRRRIEAMARALLPPNTELIPGKPGRPRSQERAA